MHCWDAGGANGFGFGSDWSLGVLWCFIFDHHDHDDLCDLWSQTYKLGFVLILCFSFNGFKYVGFITYLFNLSATLVALTKAERQGIILVNQWITTTIILKSAICLDCAPFFIRCFHTCLQRVKCLPFSIHMIASFENAVISVVHSNSMKTVKSNSIETTGKKHISYFLSSWKDREEFAIPDVPLII